MTKLKHLLVSNAVMITNLLAVCASSIVAHYLTETVSVHDRQIRELSWEISLLIDWGYIIAVTAAVFIYELPVRRACGMMQKGLALEPDLALKSRRRLLNAPYVIIAVDFITWVVAGLIFTTYLIGAGIDPLFAYLLGGDILLTALITIATAFFMLRFVIQIWLVPAFFPAGKLWDVPGTHRTRIGNTLLNLFFALNLIPLCIIIFTHLSHAHKYPAHLAGDPFLTSLNSQIIVLSLCFICLGIFLTHIVSRNISRPLTTITKVLKGVGRGDLHRKVRVTTNDEIGYTGDVINEMTKGLLERERLQRSMNVAKEVQQLLLPHGDPDIRGLDVAGRSIYCDETGGDYYDFLPLGPGGSEGTGIVVGDVSGHGLGPALLMSTARALLRLRSTQPGAPSAIVNDVNRELANDVGDSGRFMTLFFLVLEQAGRNVRWVRAGHDPAIIYNPQSDTFEELKGSGIPLGVDGDWMFQEEVRTDLPENQIILVGTDGIWEAQNARGEMFGKEPVYRMIRRNSKKSALVILEGIAGELERFQKGVNATDDITLVVVKT